MSAEPGVWPLDGKAVFSWLDDGGPTPVAVQVTPAQAKSTGQSVTVTAKVVDQDGNGMAGRVVTFDRRGMNQGTSTATTDAIGNASLTYVGTGGVGGDVVTASTPSLAGVTVSGVGTVAWTGVSPPSATAVEFVPPGAHAPSGTTTLSFRATNADGSPFSGTVRYAVGPLGNPGAFSRTATAGGGQGTINVTTAATEVEVAAFADRSSPGTFGSREDVEALGVAVVTTRALPRGTGVAFAPPGATGAVGSSVQLPFTATYSDGAAFVGTVSWCARSLSSTSGSCLSSGSVTTGTSGNGVVSVTPTTTNPSLLVTAYADAAVLGTQDPTEATGAAVVVGTSPPPVTTTSTSLPPVTTTSVPVTTTTTSLPPVTTTSVPVTTTSTSLPPVTTTSTSVPSVTTTSTSVPTTTTTLPPNVLPAAPSLLSPTDGKSLSTTDPQLFVVNAVDSDGDPYTGTVQVTNTATGIVTSFPTAAAPSGVDSEGVPTTPLGQGSYTWRARATDAEGGNGPWSGSRPFSVGNQAPIVPTLVSPEPGKALSGDDLQLFTVAASDAEGDPYTATITIRGSAGSVVASFSTWLALSGQHSQGAPAPPLAPGTYTWEAKATDAKGISGPTSARRSFSVIVNRPPGIPTLVSPAPGKVLYMDDPQVFTLAAEDPNGDTWTGTVTIKDSNGVTRDTFRTAAASSGAYATGVTTLPLSAGNYTWSATASDAGGATSTPSTSRAFTVSSKSGVPPAALPSDIPTTRASLSSLKEQTDGRSESPVISADGRFVAFESEASNLVVGDTNTYKDIFVHDRLTGLTERVSVSDGEAQASASGWLESFDPSISADGRYVAFISSATNLVAGDTNGRQDVFVRDREAGTTVRVNLSSSGAQANASTYEADISADGRHVAFASDATNLVSGDTNTLADIFVRDIDSNFTERVSTKFGSSSQVTTGTFGSRNPSISTDGRYVAFQSDGSDFMGAGNPDLNGGNDVFLHDRNSSSGTWRVSTKAPFWEDTLGVSVNPEVSPGGHYVVFESTSTDMVSGDSDTNATWDVFRFTNSGSSMQRVSFNSSQVQANDASTAAAISPDTRYVAFQSSATNLVAGDRNGTDDIFLRDLTALTTTMISHDPDGHLANNRSMTPSLSSDAMHVDFQSWATNLVAADTNSGVDVFAYNRHRSLTCASGALSAVGCLSGYGFKASSDRMGLENFYSYHAFDTGSDLAYLNVSNGNLVVQGTDLNVPGQGLNMRLTHTYNSQKDLSEGPLGRGWRIGVADGESEDLLGAVVSAVLSADVGQILEVVVTEDQFDFFDSDGTRHHFIKGGLDGPGWHSPPGVDLKLVDYLSGTERRYKATRPDGVTYEFRPSGAGAGYFLSRIADRNGNDLTFTYTSGKLSSITDANGRVMSFVWSGAFLASASYAGTTVTYTTSAGRLESIAVGGRTTSYSYNGEGLSAVTDGRGNTTTFGISGGMLTQVTDRAGEIWRIAYNTPTCQPGDTQAAVATCITDPDPPEPTTGSTHTEVYTSSAEGNLLTRRDAGDPTPRQRSYVWGDNRVLSETDEGGTTTDYTYNDNGQIVTKRESGGDGSEPLTTLMTYRDTAPGVADLIETRVAVGSSDERVWTFGRSEEGNLTSSTAPDKTVTKYSYLAGGLLSSITDPRGKTTSYGAYHASGQPGTITDPLGQARTVTYDAFGRATSIVDRNGQTWGTGYDARGNVTSRTSPAGTATFTYDANDNQTSATPPGGATVTRVWNSRDLLAEVRSTVAGVVRKSTYAYYDDGQLKEVNGPRTFASPTATQKVQIRRFPNNRVSASVAENGAVTEFTYTPEGQVRTVLAPPGASESRLLTTYTYDRRGRTTSVGDSGHSNPTTNVWSIHGELLSTKSPKGQTTSHAYDKMGRLLRTVDASGRQSTRTYDPVGNLMTLTQPEGNGGSLTTAYTYTARGEIASESDPADGSHTVEYSYDDEGRQRFRWDKHNGIVERTVEQTYRGDGALLSRTATGTGVSTHVSTFGYDAAGNMTSAAATVAGATVSSITFGYNEAFELDAWSETIYDTAGNPRTKTGSYAYQPDGLLSSRTVDGLATGYTHNAGGRETTITPWGGLGAFTHEYFTNGLLKKTTLPNGAWMEQVFDPADRLVSRLYRTPELTVPSGWTSIAYDEDDNRTSEMVTQVQPAGTTPSVKVGQASFAYDSLGRLVSSRHPFEPDTANYTLDDGGNVVKDPDTTFTFVKNRLTGRTGTDTERHDNGDTTNTTFTSSYAYDRLGNQKSEKTTATSTSTVDGGTGGIQTESETTTATRSFSYDAASHPTRVASSDGSYVAYVYDALGRMARRVEHPASGSDLVTLFFHDGASDQLAAEADAAGTVHVRYILDSAGEPVGQHKTGSRSYYLDDPRGNLTQQLDGSRNVVAVYGYDAYGEEKQSLTKAPSSWSSRLRFQMAPKDPTTGTYNLGPRLLDPGINRFVGADSFVAAAASMDLALDPLTGNRYLYAGANPAGLLDDGHAWGWAKKLYRAGKALLKNPWVRMGVAAVVCWGSAGIGCLFIASAVLGGANYLANSKKLSVGGLVKAALGEGATAAASAKAAALAAKAAAAAAAAAKAAATQAAKSLASSRAGAAAARVVDAACSFSAPTGVLMADGSRKAISEIEVGDMVLAEDPETGERGPRRVTHLWVHDDTLVDLEIDGDLVTTTEDHPFWNETDGEWQEARNLDAGDFVRTADGELVPVAGIKLGTARHATAFNLTVDGIHTYFVGVGEDNVLVHNTCGSGLKGASSGLASVFDGGSANGRSIIGVRSGLLNGGFSQTVTSNKAGYLFQNSLGEEVRIMSRSGGWDLRVRNQFGNYLDEFGNVADPSATHGIPLHSR